MYLNLKINKNIKITQLSDLENLRKQMEVFNLKPNFSELARVLKKDRRTIKRHYYQGKTKQIRNKPSKIDEYTDLLDKLLGEESIQIFVNVNLNMSKKFKIKMYILFICLLEKIFKSIRISSYFNYMRMV